MDGTARMTKERKGMFLASYAATGKISLASQDSGVTRQTHYNWMVDDEEYRKKFRGLRFHNCQKVEDGLVERLANGWEEPVYQGGELVGHKTRFDNSAAIAYLDRHDEDFIKGKQQNVDITTKGESVKQDMGTMIAGMAAADPEYLEWQRNKMLNDVD